MRNLPSLKIAAFFVLIPTVAVGVYGGTKGKKDSKKHHKYIVRFGWSTTTANDLEPAPHSVAEVEACLAAVDHSRYLIQYYDNGQANGDPKGDLDLCLPTPPPANAAVTPIPAPPQPAASGTPWALKHGLRGSPSSTIRKTRMRSRLGEFHFPSSFEGLVEIKREINR
jgi:hypothetical protein